MKELEMRSIYFLLSAVMLLSSASAAQAQRIYLTVNGGTYRQASDFLTLKSEAQEIDLAADKTFSLGANLELGPLRVSTAYVTGASLSQHGIVGKDKIADGTLLAAAADIVLRPLPRILVQPYFLGGAGIKRKSYSFKDQDFADQFEDLKATTDLALHWGVGADLMLGGFGVMAEVSDFVTFTDRKFGNHDAFGVIGLRFRLF
jgi:opacity protein-like surface antigen